MSQDALDIYKLHRLEEIENGTFSEPFIRTTDSAIFKGVFDLSPDQTDSDAGHVDQKQLKPRILVTAFPVDLDVNDEITRSYTSETYNVQFFERDDQGIPVIWLY